jgi:DNA-binding NarL/FixJ family response regulator
MGEVARYGPEGKYSRTTIDHRLAESGVIPPSPTTIPAKDDKRVSGHRQPFATVLAGPSRLLLEGLARLLDKSDFQVVGSAVSVDRLPLSDLREHKTVLLILDAGGDIETALRQVRSFTTLHETGRIAVILGALSWADIVSLFQAGAHACFPEGTAVDVFLKSLELAMLGETLVPSALLPSLSSHETPPPADIGSMLSPQEERILSGLSEGRPNKVIAGELGIADATVKIHVKNILRKLRVDNRTQAAVWAMNRASPNWRSERPLLAPDIPADKASPPAIPGTTQHDASHEPPPAVNGSLEHRAFEAPKARCKLEDADARPDRGRVAPWRLSPSDRRIAEEQERRE